MSASLTAGEVQTIAQQLRDLAAAVQYRFADVPADMVVAGDVLGDLAAIGIPYTGVIKAFLPLVGWAVTHNQSAMPGALVHIASGARGGALQAEQPPQEDDGA